MSVVITRKIFQLNKANWKVRFGIRNGNKQIVYTIEREQKELKKAGENVPKNLRNRAPKVHKHTKYNIISKAASEFCMFFHGFTVRNAVCTFVIPSSSVLLCVYSFFWFGFVSSQKKFLSLSSDVQHYTQKMNATLF